MTNTREKILEMVEDLADIKDIVWGLLDNTERSEAPGKPIITMEQATVLINHFRASMSQGSSCEPLSVVEVWTIPFP